jgi:hypothetical protein
MNTVYIGGEKCRREAPRTQKCDKSAQWTPGMSAVSYWPTHFGAESSGISVEKNSHCNKSQSTRIWQYHDNVNVVVKTTFHALWHCALARSLVTSGESGDSTWRISWRPSSPRRQNETLNAFNLCRVMNRFGQSHAGSHKSYGALNITLGTFALRRHNYCSQQRYVLEQIH